MDSVVSIHVTFYGLRRGNNGEIEEMLAVLKAASGLVPVLHALFVLLSFCDSCREIRRTINTGLIPSLTAKFEPLLSKLRVSSGYISIFTYFEGPNPSKSKL